MPSDGACRSIRVLPSPDLITAAVALRHGDPSLRCAFTATALVLSLAGDVFLMLPRNLFVAGLGSFLLVHVAYIVAFNSPASNGFSPILVVFVAGALLFFASDGMIGWIRFVSDFPGSGLLSIVTYHLGQVAVLGLLEAK
jgi:uncharacterized membrane protein YhhN